MNKRITKYMKRNIIRLFFLFIFINFTLIIRLFYIHYYNHNKYKQKVYAQQTVYNKEIPFKRGSILDRKSNVLAMSEKVYDLVFDPEVLGLSSKKAKNDTLKSLNKYFNLNIKELNEIMKKYKKSNWKVLKKGLKYEQIKKFEELMKNYEDDIIIKGVHLPYRYVRNYPNNELACHTLGFALGEVRVGLESYYDDMLEGTIGREYGVITEGLHVERKRKEPVNGYDIITTIDQNIQEYTEEAIKEFYEKYGSLKISAVVMNPSNGEILSMASLPNYDLNKPYNLEKYLSKNGLDKMSSNDRSDFLSKLWRNPVISDTFEPGSTYKPITIAAALEEQKILGSETFYCDGFQVVSNSRISCWKHSGHGVQTTSQALANSCNDALMEIGRRLGKNDFIKYQKRFGFGQKTNIDLPAEASAENLLIKKENMGPVELATSSFGQSFNVTMIQLVRAFSAVVNDGEIVQPHIVKRIIDDKGNIINNFDKKVVDKVISKQTSDMIKSYLLEAVDDGTGKYAQIEGYKIGGKTGQAEKGKRKDENFIISFIGCAPIKEPKIVVYVTIDEPNVDEVSSSYATKIVQKIMSKTLPYINIYPTNS